MKFDKSLVEKYLNNQCTPKEARAVLDWFDTEEGQHFLEQHIAYKLQQTEDKSHFLFKDPVDSEKLLANIYQKESQYASIGQAIVGSAPFDLSPQKRSWPLFVAACISLFLLTGAIYWFVMPTERIYHTSFGETRQITLPDQSVVTLNANSTLKVADTNWEGQKPREVWLEGEAYFSVVHTHNHRKFLVHTPKQFSVQVLGTEFNVTTRKAHSRVVLNSGSIQLHIQEQGEENTILMKPGEAVEFEENSAYYVKKEVNPVQYSAWKENKLIFDQTSIEELVQILKDNYGISVLITDKTLLRQTISGSFPSDDVDLLLEGLSRLLTIEVIREGNLVKFQQIHD
ncbi:FecR domain-containing protein [Rapidithrix thailandica]|uniref:FecR domain-containing protein n=1 Tax=Rapidithrix thailandica TaxID=413964 RepID=A0AAW9S7Z4_9BACT